MPARDDIDRISQAQSRLVARSDRQRAPTRRDLDAVPRPHDDARVAQGPDAERRARATGLAGLFGEAEDIATLDSLIRSIGAERTAAIQSELDELLGLGPDLRSRPPRCGPRRRAPLLRDRLARSGRPGDRRIVAPASSRLLRAAPRTLRQPRAPALDDRTAATASDGIARRGETIVARPGPQATRRAVAERSLPRRQIARELRTDRSSAASAVRARRKSGRLRVSTGS